MAFPEIFVISPWRVLFAATTRGVSPDSIAVRPSSKVSRSLATSSAVATRAASLAASVLAANGGPRQPIREALYELQADGWIELRPGQGAFVHSPTDEEIEQLLDVSPEGTLKVRFVGYRTACPLKPFTLASTVRPALVGVKGVNEVEAVGVRLSEEAAGRLAGLRLQKTPHRVEAAGLL